MDKPRSSCSGDKKTPDTLASAPTLDHARKIFARQRAKDFAEHAKVGIYFNVRITQICGKMSFAI